MSTPSRLGRALAAAASTVAAALLFAAGGCGDSQEAYDVSCNVDEDCVVVPTRPSCNSGCVSCGRTVINAGEVERYNEDLSEIDCDDISVSCPGACDEPRGACVEGTCALR